jgi:light-regulated signal transduction histidine kinase (bacteriophytochrome)
LINTSDRSSQLALKKAIDSACSKEQIQFPGLIQPHGALLALDPARNLVVRAASRNAGAMVGSAPGQLIGRAAASVLGNEFADAIRQRLDDNKLPGESPWQSTLALGAASFDAAVHTYDGLVIVELEPADPQAAAAEQASLRLLREVIVDLRQPANGLIELARVATRGVRLLTGYERVLIYRFDAEWNGQSIGEDKIASWHQSLDGLISPASNIPAQARELYRRNPIRWVPDIDAPAVPLDADPATPVIDLTFATLRSMSPKHSTFQRSMGVNGSMSLSILRDGQLWGLVVCHHREAHHVSANQRAAVAALTDAFGLRVGIAERAATELARRGDSTRLSLLLAHMAQAEAVAPALTSGDVTINSLFEATGAAVVYEGDVTLLGVTQSEIDIRELTIWLRAQAGGGLFQTSNLTALYPAWGAHTAIASGLMAVFLSPDRSDMLLWFRPEESLLVSWGGNPYEGNADALAYPSKISFERWVEARNGGAKPWAEWETEIAESLRHGITEVIIRALRRIGDLNDKLRQSQKMEAIGQLTGGIAHDFNNLLTGITGSLDLIRTRITQGRMVDLDRFIGMAETSANRAASLTHRLLAFSRRQMLDPRSVDINRLTVSMQDLVHRTVGPAIHVETVISGGLWRTLCDANQLENALLNLAINARDAMPDGGRLTIEASNARLDDAFARLHPGLAPGQYVSVSVSDTGTGMSPELVARAFEPFFTTKPLGQGTGLGLSMVYGFTRQSNGYAGIYSEVGIGTTIRMYLPRFLGPGEIEPDQPVMPDASAKAGEVVLVVDDEPIVRMLVGEVLRDLDYQVIEAANGADGLRILQSGQAIDLLVSDVGLPGGMNGRQLADAARLHRPDLKVLFITGYAENAVLGGGILEPGMQVITKPFAMDVFAAKVRSMT